MYQADRTLTKYVICFYHPQHQLKGDDQKQATWKQRLLTAIDPWMPISTINPGSRYIIKKSRHGLITSRFRSSYLEKLHGCFSRVKKKPIERCVVFERVASSSPSAIDSWTFAPGSRATSRIGTSDREQKAPGPTATTPTLTSDGRGCYLWNDTRSLQKLRRSQSSRN